MDAKYSDRKCESGLSEEENIRYGRILSISRIGEEGMRKLRHGRVMVVGCGALGSVAAMYLAGSGVGKIGIADFDTIDISNLQRQLFYEEKIVGSPKAEALAERINSLNSGVSLEIYKCLINEDKARSIFNEYDFIIDATDNPSSKFMTDKVCRELGKPYCIGGVREGEGQVMSWHVGSAPYSEVFSSPVCTGGFTPCSICGVLGPAAGVVASIQASEAIKHLTGAGEMLYDKIFTIDLFSMSSSLLRLD